MVAKEKKERLSLNTLIQIVETVHRRIAPFLVGVDRQSYGQTELFVEAYSGCALQQLGRTRVQFVGGQFKLFKAHRVMLLAVAAFAVVEDVVFLLLNEIDRQTIAGHFGLQQVLETLVERV